MSLATQQLSSLVTPPPQGDSDTSIMKIEIGPSHPAMHGIVRFTTYLDGELIVGMEPEIGYLHRGFEKSLKIPNGSRLFPTRIGSIMFLLF